MPSIWSGLDTGFPKIDGNDSTEAKLMAVQDYLYMLVEELGHTLRNLDMARNMNKASLARFTEPIYGRIADNAGNITELSIKADGIAARVSNAEGDLTELSIKADGIISRVSSAEGNITALSIKADGIISRVSSAEGAISVVSQKADRIDWVVASGTDASNFTMTARMASLVSSSIDFTGFVTVHSLSEYGTTTIDGSRITSGVITGATLKSVAPNTQVWIREGGVEIYDGWGWLAGGLRYDTNGGGFTESPTRVFLYTTPGNALKIETYGANLSIEAKGGMVYAMGGWSFWGANVVGLPEPSGD